MILRFLHARGGNAFLREILEALCAAVQVEGAEARMVEGLAGPAEPGTVDVVVPHEYWHLTPEAQWPSAERCRRTVAVITEHPGTYWFDVSTLLAAGLGASFALNRGASVRCRSRGLDTAHLQLGYVPGWDRWRGADTNRPIDVTYMGISEPRRNAILAGYGDDLARWRTSILVPPAVPTPAGRPGFLTGTQKWDHLAGSRVLLNLHRDGVSDTEWPRVIEAICNGAVVVSEPCSDASPLEPGVHYLAAAPDRLALAASALLEDPARLLAVRDRAYDLVRTSLPISAAARALLERAAALPTRRRGQLSLVRLQGAVAALPLPPGFGPGAPVAQVPGTPRVGSGSNRTAPLDIDAEQAAARRFAIDAEAGRSAEIDALRGPLGWLRARTWAHRRVLRAGRRRGPARSAGARP